MAYRNNGHFNYYSLPSLYPQQYGGQEISYNNFGEFVHPLYESDEFYMYIYKIKKCTNLRVHDWNSCPFTHGQGEKAHRRDPRQYNYLPIPCPGYKFASCIKRDNCELCHGVFEYWLHPAKYRTTPCRSGTLCNRRACFFAHTLNELRTETKYNWCYIRQYPSHIQFYPDILIETKPNGNWMIIPCNPQLQPSPQNQYYDTIVSRHEISQENTSMSELFVPSPPSPSFQSQSRIDPTVQNESSFSLFSASHAKLIEEFKNLEIVNTFHTKINEMSDERGKKPMEFDSHDQEFPNVNWVSDLLGDEIEGKNL